MRPPARRFSKCRRTAIVVSPQASAIALASSPPFVFSRRRICIFVDCSAVSAITRSLPAARAGTDRSKGFPSQCMRLATPLSIQTFLNIYVDKLAQSHVSLAWGLSRGSSEPMKDLNSVTTQEAVFQALATIRDPDLGRDIVSLGFIKDLKV